MSYRVGRIDVDDLMEYWRFPEFEERMDAEEDARFESSGGDVIAVIDQTTENRHKRITGSIVTLVYERVIFQRQKGE